MQSGIDREAGEGGALGVRETRTLAVSVAAGLAALIYAAASSLAARFRSALAVSTPETTGSPISASRALSTGVAIVPSTARPAGVNPKTTRLRSRSVRRRDTRPFC